MGTGDQQRQRLLPAPVGVGHRSGDHAPDRRVASGGPVRGQPDVARSMAAGGHRDRLLPRYDADEENGYRGALSPSKYLEAGAGTQDLPLSAAHSADRAARQGMGYGHQLHPDGKGLRLSSRDRRLVQSQGA